MRIAKGQVLGYQQWLASKYEMAYAELKKLPVSETDMSPAQALISQRARGRMDAYHNAVRNLERAFDLPKIVLS